jgi:LysM repeat protein
VNYLQRSLLLVLMVFITLSGVKADDLIHMVGRGETIYSISRFYGVATEDLMRVNNISDPSRLLAGSRLKIPSAIAENAQQLTDYRVVRGDTLYGIARANGINLQTLLDINNFSSNHMIKADDIIKVPAHGIVTTQSTPSANNSVPVSTSTGIYSLSWPVSPKNISYMTGQMGVVIEGEHAESVKSLTAGKVISAGPWRKFGRVVIVETVGGYFYMYGGCDSLSVNVGDRVSPGTEVGRLGINAVSEKPQAFLMVFRNEIPVDPALAPRTSGNTRT